VFRSLRDRFLALPDYVQVWPGHGAGSACGKALGAVPVSTVGYERLFSWWGPFVEGGDEEGFVEALLEGQPDAPAYFGRMKRQNKAGPVLLGERPRLKRYAPPDLDGELRVGEILFVDTRSLDAYRKGAVTGALQVPGGKSFASWAAWVIDPEKEKRPIVLLARDGDDAARLRDRLSYVGIDNVAGFVSGVEGLRTEPAPTTTPEKLERAEDVFVLDVRARSEYEAGHIPEAHQLHGGA
jgi:hydroxyacylglutathione hydrolase